MPEHNDNVPAFYVPNYILCRFVSADDNSNGAFPTIENSYGLMMPDWLWRDLRRDLGDVLTGTAADQLVYPLCPTDLGRTVVLAQCALAAGEGDQVLKLIEHVGSDGLSKIFSDGTHTVLLTNVSPNWLGGGAGQTIGTGGPGGPPLEPDPNNLVAKSFAFPNATAILAQNRGVDPGFVPNEVDVFILDTKPANMKRVSEGIVDHLESCDTRLLDELVENNVPLYSAANPYYDMSDHGLFIAGIIRDIAPNAKIHLIEVLNKYGVGTTMSMAAGCAMVRALRRPNATPCVVNCSFTLSVPIDPQLVGWRGLLNATSHPEVGFFMKLLGDLAEKLMKQAGDFFGSILKFIGSEDGDSATVAIVAAAGNDTKEADRPPCPPRYPAALPSVLGVGAMENSNGAFSRASYSNIPDSPAGYGLMTLGTIRSVFTTSFPMVDGANKVLPPLNPPDSKELVPALMNGANLSHLAIWSGTSFAAPVVAGLLANMVSVPGVTLASALKDLRRSENTPPERTTGGEIVTVTQ